MDQDDTLILPGEESTELDPTLVMPDGQTHRVRSDEERRAEYENEKAAVTHEITQSVILDAAEARYRKRAELAARIRRDRERPFSMERILDNPLIGIPVFLVASSCFYALTFITLLIALFGALKDGEL